MSRPPEKQKKPSLSPPGKGKKRLGHLEQLALYASAKRRQEQVATWMLQETPEFVKQAEALNGCGSWLWFHNFFRLNKVLLRGGITCKQHILCAPCALRRSAAYAKAYFPVIKHLLDSNSGFAPVLITKTIRNSPDLGSLYSQFTKAHSGLMQSRRNALKAKRLRLRNPTVYASLHGGVGSYEYKRGKNSDLWHPHSHEIALISLADWQIEPIQIYKGKNSFDLQTIWKPLELEHRLREEWKMLTAGSFMCDVRMIGWNEDGEYDEEGLFGAVAEVMGYCLKMQDISPADQVEAYRVLRRRRLTYTYGCLRNVELPPEAYDTDELIPEDEPWIELEYRWWSGGYNLTSVREQDQAYFSRPQPKTGSRKKTPSVKVLRETDQTIQDWLSSMQSAVPF